MPETRRTALPEGIPAEGLKVVRTESEEDLERKFAELADDGFVPAQGLEVEAKFDEDAGQWKVLYVLPMWKVGQAFPEGEEEIYR